MIGARLARPAYLLGMLMIKTSDLTGNCEEACYNLSYHHLWQSCLRRKVVMGRLGVPELLIVLAIVLLIFGGGKLSKLGGDLGGGIREFKRSLSGEGEEAAQE